MNIESRIWLFCFFNSIFKMCLANINITYMLQTRMEERQLMLNYGCSLFLRLSKIQSFWLVRLASDAILLWFGSYMSATVPCAEDWVPSLWHYWEEVDPLGGWGCWEEVRSLGVCLWGGNRTTVCFPPPQGKLLCFTRYSWQWCSASSQAPKQSQPTMDWN